MRKSTRNSRKPFWKKWGVEAKHITNHIGKVVDNSNINQMMKLLAWGSSSFLIFDAVKTAQGLPLFMGAGDIASALETFFLGKPLAPAPSVMTEQQRQWNDIQWALLSMVAGWLVVDQGAKFLDALIPL